MTRYLILLSLLAGCAGAPFRMADYSDDELAELHVIELCFHYASHDRFDEKIRRELDRRGSFTEKEWEAIDQHKVFVGMSRDAFRCSWPRHRSILYDPQISYASKEGPWGTREVVEYLKLGWLDPEYSFLDTIPHPYPKRIYFENDVLVAYKEGDEVQKSDCFDVFSHNNECFSFEDIETSSSSPLLMN